MDAKLHLDSPTDWIDWENDEHIMCGDYGRNFKSYYNGMIIST